MSLRPLRGLYAITPGRLLDDAPALEAAVDAALKGGVRLLQYRDKRPAPQGREDQAARLLARCRAAGVAFIINDDLELATAIGADGVHLGRDDGSLAAARARLGPQAILGATCGDSLARAEAAVAAGASYVAFGRYFPSRTKPEAPPAALATLTAARARLPVPVCAIGGVTPENAPALIAAGADLVAAVEGLFGAADITATARAYGAAFAVAVR